MDCYNKPLPEIKILRKEVNHMTSALERMDDQFVEGESRRRADRVGRIKELGSALIDQTGGNRTLVGAFIGYTFPTDNVVEGLDTKTPQSIRRSQFVNELAESLELKPAGIQALNLLIMAIDIRLGDRVGPVEGEVKEKQDKLGRYARSPSSEDF